VASPSHSVSVAHANNETGNVLTVSLACRASLDRDFILVVDQLAHDSVAIAARDAVEPESMAILASFCPRLHAKNPESAAVKILVDCSGSMAGDSIEAAKRALQAIVQQFGAGDRFSLSRFGSTVEHRSRGLWKATETTKRAAQRWVEELEADLGGTEMESALTSTFALAQTVSSDVLIVTDGEISAIDQTIESAKASGHRLFVVGIGSSPTETHLHRLAEATGGACDFVAPGEAVEPAVLRMFARLRSPRLVDLRLDWPEGITPTWVSPLQLSVFDGDTVNVFALLRQMPEGERGGELHLQGKRFDDEAFQKIGCVSFSGEVASADTLSRMVASARIKALENEDQAEVETQRLALAYQLLSDQTNFLLIHERQEGEKAADMPVLRKVDQMLPAGWGSMGSALAEKRVAYLNDVPSYGVLYQKAKKFNDMAAIVRARKPVAYLSDVSYDNPLLCQISVNHDKKGSMGLTPLEVSEWLCTTPKSEWPTSYDGLNEIGIHKRLLVWLIRLIIPHGVALFEESKVVTAFLYLMSRQATHNVLAKSAGIFKFTRRQLREIFSREPAADPASIDVSLLETIADALNGMRGDAWPEQVWSRRSAKDKTEK
jgi:Ca-activated chloride channel family protein